MGEENTGKKKSFLRAPKGRLVFCVLERLAGGSDGTEIQAWRDPRWRMHRDRC